MFFIGPQGSGKSTIAKIISFCSWLDKRISDDAKVQYCITAIDVS